MSDIAQLEQKLLSDSAAANDEAALEAVRVSTLGECELIFAPQRE